MACLQEQQWRLQNPDHAHGEEYPHEEDDGSRKRQRGDDVHDAGGYYDQGQQQHADGYGHYPSSLAGYDGSPGAKRYRPSGGEDDDGHMHEYGQGAQHGSDGYGHGGQYDGDGHGGEHYSDDDGGDGGGYRVSDYQEVQEEEEGGGGGGGEQGGDDPGYEGEGW